MGNDMKRIERALADAGFLFHRKRASHTTWRHPDGRQWTTAAKNGDPRGIRNLRRDLRKLGVEL